MGGRLLDAALKFIRRGIAVFPLNFTIGDKCSCGKPDCSSPGKHPFFSLAPNGVKNASKDEAQIRKWWTARPEANVGVALGEISGVFAVDLDDGATTEHLKLFPRTVTAKTRDGFHLFFKHAAVKNGKFDLPKTVPDAPQGCVLGPAQANVRSDGYYVVGVGSTVLGWDYDWHSDLGGELSFDECALAEAPSFLQELQKNVTHVTQNVTQNVTQIADVLPGGRHVKLIEIAVAIRKKGKSQEQARLELHAYNQEHCKPPKPLDEVDSAIDWAFRQVLPSAPDAKENEFIIPLGHSGSEYFYTTSSNGQINQISAGSHTALKLLDLMPMTYWEKRFPKTSDKGTIGVLWQNAASELMTACRDAGIFEPGRVRGSGCWRDGNKIVTHLGDRLFVGGKTLGLGDVGSDFIYSLGKSLPDVSDAPLSLNECGILIEACNAPTWRNKGDGILLAGAMALFRIGGALSWRPMIWITGPAGSGKSTLMTSIVQNVGGKFSVRVLGASTEAGIRQRLGSNSLPVIYDEAEQGDKNTARRMRAIMELVRQASSESDFLIVKGTPDGKGFFFKIQASFLLSSIRVNLTEEADATRFCLLELERGNPQNWPSVRQKIFAVTPEYGDRLFARSLQKFDVFQKNREILEPLIAARADMRAGQQFGALLAGYWLLRSDTAITQIDADALIDEIDLLHHLTAEKVTSDRDEEHCIDKLLDHPIDVKDTRMTIGDALRNKAMLGEQIIAESLRLYGIAVTQGDIIIASTNSELQKIYRDTKWDGAWAKSLGRLPGASYCHTREFGKQRRALRLPLSHLFS